MCAIKHRATDRRFEISCLHSRNLSIDNHKSGFTFYFTLSLGYLLVPMAVMRCFDLGVAGYMAKPVDYRQFVEVMRTIDAYWTISEVPQ